MHGGGGGGSGGPPPAIALASPTCPAMATARASRIGGRCHPGPRVRRHCPIPIVAVSVGLVALLLAGTRGGGLCCCSSISPRCSLGAVARGAHAPTAGTKPLPPPASNGCVRHAPRICGGSSTQNRRRRARQPGTWPARQQPPVVCRGPRYVRWRMRLQAAAEQQCCCWRALRAVARRRYSQDTAAGCTQGLVGPRPCWPRLHATPGWCCAEPEPHLQVTSQDDTLLGIPS